MAFREKYLKYKEKYLNLKISIESTIKNASIILLTPNGYIIVRDIYEQKWMFPGGGIDKSETETEAAVREFNEETSFILDIKQLKFTGYYDYRLSRIFVAYTTQQFDLTKFKQTDETDSIAFIPQQKLEDLICNSFYILKESNKASLSMIIQTHKKLITNNIINF